jgi:hypothetical protein
MMGVSEGVEGAPPMIAQGSNSIVSISVVSSSASNDGRVKKANGGYGSNTI